MANTKVIILGSGFAGLTVAKSLGNTSLDVWLIDRTNHHLFQPLLYEVATTLLSFEDIAVPIREILAPYKNITVMMGEVVSIDKDKRIIALRNNEYVGFDFLIVALGSHDNYHGHDEWRNASLGLKSLSDALKIRERILMSFEKARRCDNYSNASKFLNFVIIGGGPRGVEMAGAIAEMVRKTMIRNFRHIDPSAAKIFLIEKLPRILNSFPEPLAQKSQTYLEKLGVRVMIDADLSRVTAQGVWVDQTFIPSQNVFWAAGDAASPVLKTLDIPLDRQGRAIVNSDLSIVGHPEIFVIGDAASVQDPKGAALPAVAPAAIQQGRYVGKILKQHREKNEREPFRYFDKGMLATIGKTKAVGIFMNIPLSGFLAWIIWGFIHLFYLTGLRNRISVLLEWVFSFFFDKRGARLIYGSIDEELPKDDK